ncbi:MAG: lipoate--protein ligase family protein [Planctomycetota bacterium]|nr:MAG: lipoate--protein ligase family protein [Planctomycetota bacterium]
MNKSFRWIIDPPMDGPSNMARDEALLQSVDRGQAPPSLRFYRWSEPTISLGYFQRYADYDSLPPPAGGLTVVRRVTGGGAIIHDLELTYSLTLPLDHPFITTNGPNALYDRVHSAFAELLLNRGVPVTRGPINHQKTAQPCDAAQPEAFFCFDRHCGFDLMINNRKLMGSAQRRKQTAVMQHGSLILDTRFKQQTCAAVSQYADININQALPRLVELITYEPVGNPGILEPEETQLADQLRIKYSDPAWTKRR